MSITTVSAQIRTAMKDRFITKAEAETIVNEAEKGPVTFGEANAIRELFERAPKAASPGNMMTLAIPENPNDVTFAADAKNVLETFFARNNVPAGRNRRETFLRVLEAAGDFMNAPLAQAPDTKKLHRMQLNPQAVPAQSLFVNHQKNEGYVSVEGVNGAPTKWYGPVSLEQKQSWLSDG